MAKEKSWVEKKAAEMRGAYKKAASKGYLGSKAKVTATAKYKGSKKKGG